MSEVELKGFLKLAFEEGRMPEKRFVLSDIPNKHKIMKVFHNYYKNVAGKPHGKQSKYAALLGDYFEGFETRNVSTNFNK